MLTYNPKKTESAHESKSTRVKGSPFHLVEGVVTFVQKGDATMLTLTSEGQGWIRNGNNRSHQSPDYRDAAGNKVNYIITCCFLKGKGTITLSLDKLVSFMEMGFISTAWKKGGATPVPSMLDGRINADVRVNCRIASKKVADDSEAETETAAA